MGLKLQIEWDDTHYCTVQYQLAVPCPNWASVNFNIVIILPSGSSDLVIYNTDISAIVVNAWVVDHVQEKVDEDHYGTRPSRVSFGSGLNVLTFQHLQ